MKKNITFLHLNLTLLDWLMDEALRAQDEIPGTEDLWQSLNDLLEGRSDSVLVNLSHSYAFLSRTTDKTPIFCDDLLIDPKSRTVLQDGAPLALTPKEFDILFFLAHNRGEVFTKEQIYRAVWDGDYLMDDSNIMAFIRKLRKKIEPNPDAPEYILTIWGVGYKFREESPEDAEKKAKSQEKS